MLDVVPVDPETVGSWKYPPYSGHFDGERIWGRGTADDKNGLIATLFVSPSISTFACPDISNRAAVEYLVSTGFEPARTLVLAFGFDEESSGAQARILFPHGFDHTYVRDFTGCWGSVRISFGHIWQKRICVDR